MTAYVLLLIVGMGLLVKGADLFVSGASNIAKALKIPPLVIGLTLVSMGTSAPEASVSINGAINSAADLSVGNIVGSNIFNTLFILGLSALIAPIKIDDEVKKADIPFMLIAYMLIPLLTLVITPMRLSALEAVILTVAFVLYTVALIIRTKATKKRASTTTGCVRAASTERLKPRALLASALYSVVGLSGIILGGESVVQSASEIAIDLGMSKSLVGLTIVAVGTSLPELMTSVVAAVKKENDIAIGNVIGSNIFNVLFILGVSATIKEVSLSQSAILDIAVMTGSGILLSAIALSSKTINRAHALTFLAAYVGYTAYIIVRN